ncbi:peroxisomal sarcosine oxidase [Danio rerio]|uniref:Peroxisomal sarcosine oxidase n=2 Tax=Danio rerio TaxID=7955 RepID=A0A8M1P8J4_DANRE|nr:peroxisomal sarcosine oxidase [Danio rerio]|eukprot:NP_001313319.1 peroxisomal sarcosine oxidase [Danio rerio]
MSSKVFDCIVIGAGIQGSCTAYQLAKNKQKTLLLEQFVLPHSRGSSHGQTRIIRKAYEEDFYTQMMQESYELWAELEKEAGVELYRRTGLLVMGPEKSEGFSKLKDTMQRHKIPTVFLEKQEFNEHISNVNLSEGNGALIDTFAGVLYAERSLQAVQRLFQCSGGVLKDGQTVTGVSPGAVVTVSTGSAVYRGKSVVITAGPWANTLLAHAGLQLPLKVVKINVCYWKEKIPGTYSVDQSFPCFIQMEPKEGEYDIYGLPSNEYPGLMKVCYHMGSETDPDERDKQTDRGDIDILARYVTRCLPGLVPAPAVVESCMYTVTPDHHFVLDSHPSYGNIIIGAGFSGHGFKFSPIIGKVLSQLAMGQVPSHDLSPFRIQRFQSQSKSSL